MTNQELREAIRRLPNDASRLAFARWCVMDVIAQWPKPPAPAALIAFLRGGDERLRLPAWQAVYYIGQVSKGDETPTEKAAVTAALFITCPLAESAEWTAYIVAEAAAKAADYAPDRQAMFLAGTLDQARRSAP